MALRRSSPGGQALVSPTHPHPRLDFGDMAAVGLLTLEVYIPGVASLKEKRGIVKPVVARIRKEFNVSVAEVEDMDQLGHMVIAVAAVSSSAEYIHGLLQRVAESVEAWRLDAELVDYTIEML